MNSDNCIICGLPIQEKSIEHIIPEAIGGKLTIGSVCRTCNSLLGDKIDYKLTDSLLFLWIRTVLSIKNRDRKIPNLYNYYRDSNGDKVILKHGDGINMPEVYDGSKPPKFEILSIDGNKIQATFSGSDENSIIKSGIREFAKKGLHVSEEELRSIVREGSEVSWGNTHIDLPIKYEPFIYLPCFVKIAYETMCTLFPLYSSDPRCEELRHFLYTYIQDCYTNDFHCDDIMHDHSIGEPVFTYYAYFSVRSGKLYMDINLFNKVMMLIPVSDEPSKYPLEEYVNTNLFEAL